MDFALAAAQTFDSTRKIRAAKAGPALRSTPARSTFM
jgi:hypothetical protein